MAIFQIKGPEELLSKSLIETEIFKRSKLRKIKLRDFTDIETYARVLGVPVEEFFNLAKVNDDILIIVYNNAYLVHPDYLIRTYVNKFKRAIRAELKKKVVPSH